MAVQIIRVLILIVGILCVFPIIVMSYASIFFDVVYSTGSIKTGRIMVTIGTMLLAALMATPTYGKYKI